MLGAINMRTELTAFLRELTDARQGEDLEPATVREDRALPAIETMQASRSAKYLKSRPQIEMVGITKYNLCFNLSAQLTEMHGFHGTTGTYGHEDRGFDLTMVCSDDTSTSLRG